MSAPEPRLEQVQRWMQSVIMHRGGVAEGVESPEARAHIDLSLSELGRVILRSRALSSADRLEIYVNAYYARLMECLEEEFVVTRRALGEELFAAVTFGYLQSYPSQSYTLNQLGARFPRYLAEARLHAADVPEGAGPTWADFIAELAAFERAMYEVYDGPGTEGAPAFDPAPLTSGGDWETLRLIVAPCLKLLTFSHPVSDYWEVARDGPAPATCEPRETHVAINRRDYVVERYPLLPAEFVLLRELAEGAALASALAAAHAAWPPGDPFEAQLGPWFTRWVAGGFFSAVESDA